ncbi:MAG: TIGR03435 family protein, partial [Vicinamibacterales bacterium]
GVGRPVIDATGLTEQFQWELKWTPDSAGGSLPADGVSIFTALQEQLGVKLEPATGPIDVLVIDSVEQPEEN